MIPHTYLILGSRTQTLHFGQYVIMYIPCPKEKYHSNLKYAATTLKKELDHGSNTQIPSIYIYVQYIYMVKIHQQYLEHLPYWWYGGAGAVGNNRIDI